MPTLEFKGKQFVYSHHLNVPFRELRVEADKSLPAEGQKPSLDDNLIIHGDNLEALKALLPTHAGKVDCIFIDPPYNTGNEGWCYNDNVRSPLMQEWLKKSANPVDKEDLERHDKWLCMMWPRIHLLKELLSDDGIFVVTIGNDEQHSLRNILDEIFGEDSFITTLAWRSRAKPVNVGDAKLAPQNDAEYIHIYSKNPEAVVFNKCFSGEIRRYPYSDKDGSYRLQTILKSNRGESKRETMRFEIGGYTPPEDQRWQGAFDFINDLFKSNRLEFKDGTPFRKYYEHEEDDQHSPFYTYIERSESSTAEAGKTTLNQILGNQHGMDTVKPLDVVEYIINHAVAEDAIVLDSFAGSGTTAHAVLKLNHLQKMQRKFILVECEDYADTLTAERMRRVIKGYSFSGTHKDELLSEKITWTVFNKKQPKILEQINQIEQKNKDQFDKIKKEIKDGVLTVTGERKIEEFAPGLGGSFTFCSLGEPIQIESLLTGDDMPSFEALARYVFYTATGQSIETVGKPSVDGFVGETDLFRIHLFYQPNKEWLRSNEAALNFDKVKVITENNPTNKRTIVFAVAKFMSQKELTAKRIEFCQLPYAIHRIMGA